MPADRTTTAPDRRNVRSKVTNGSRLTLYGGQRSTGFRRFKDLVEAFGDELGGFDKLPETGKQTVRRIASLSVEIELQEAERASGGNIDPISLGTLINVQGRLLRDFERLKAARKAAEPKLSFAERLAALAHPAVQP